MKNNVGGHTLQDVANSKFLKSIFLRITSVFIFVIIAIIAIVFTSFTTEINKSRIEEKQKQLESIEDTISARMDEIYSIIYNMSNDEMFYLSSVSSERYSSYEMSKTLDRYLVGNSYMEHLVYYRLAEPDKVYMSSGEVSLNDFWSTYLNFKDLSQDEYMTLVLNSTNAHMISVQQGQQNKSYLSYVCAIPQFSEKPQAFVLMLIPEKQLQMILSPQLNGCYGETAVFDAQGKPLYEMSNLDRQIPIQADIDTANPTISFEGQKYIVQKTVSDTNGWTYVSILRLSDITSEIAAKQIFFILLLFILMLIGIFAVLRSVVIQYKPINALAKSVTDSTGAQADTSEMDELTLLSDTFATLKDDSAQKQKFEEAYYAAEAANKAKSAFLSNMSHDIRTPMNSVVGMTEIALKHIDDPAYVKECLRNVQVASRYLLDIINNVLDMSCIESGQFSLASDEVSLTKLIHEIITILNHSMEVKSQKLLVEVHQINHENIIGDNVRLTQIFMNILSNSVKFTPNGGTIRMDFRELPSSEDGYGDYCFVFSDTGIGMSPEFISKVFDTFTRDDKTTATKIEGTGLGMAIAKNLVELMGGTIQCESEQNVGSTFTIHMHFKLAKEEACADYSTEKYADTRLLILGNEMTECLNQCDIFSELHVKADYALSLNSAIDNISAAAAQNKPYSYLVINQDSSDKSGIATVTRLRKISSTADMKYILIARDSLSIDRSGAFNAGIATFLQTPLFRSTALCILDRSYEKDNILNSDAVVDLTGMRILLVEDNPLNRQIATVIISETKATVFEASNGKEAVDAFKEHEIGFFDLILMDVQMPVMNGFEATAAIRSIQRADAAGIPIYAMTANTFDEDVRQVKEAGMNGHLGKPYSSVELYKILANVYQK